MPTIVRQPPTYLVVTRTPGRPGAIGQPRLTGPTVARGRHHLGTPGTVLRYPAGPPARTGPTGRGPTGSRRTPRHRHTRPAASAARYGALLVVAGTLAVSGWFTASGASAFAQMVQP